MGFIAGGLWLPSGDGIWSYRVANVAVLEDPANDVIELGLPAGSGAGSAAASGGVRLQGNGAIPGRVVFRGDTDVNDVAGISVIAGDHLFVGGAYPNRPERIRLDALTEVNCATSGVARLQVFTTEVVPRVIVSFVNSLANPRVTQANDPTVAVAADDLGFIAQSATGGGASVGGTAYIQGGTGATNGVAEMRDSAGVVRVSADSNIVYLDAASSVSIRRGGGARMTFDVGHIEIGTVPDFRFANGVTSPIVRHEDDATVAVAADDLGFIAQSATGGGASVGGTAYLQGGTGTTPGEAELRDSAGNPIVVANSDGSGATINGKLTVTGLIDPTGLVLTEQAADPTGGPNPGEGVFWVKNDAPSTPYYTDDTGADFQLATGGAVIWSYRAANVAVLNDPANDVIELGLPAGSGAGSAADAGVIQLQDDFFIAAREAADAANFTVLAGNGANSIWLGGLLGGTRPAGITIDPENGTTFRKAGVFAMQVLAAELDLVLPLISFRNTSVNPLIRHDDDATVAVAADDLGFIAQSATGGGASVGGTAYIQGGTGATNGAAEMRDTAGTPKIWVDSGGNIYCAASVFGVFRVLGTTILDYNVSTLNIKPTTDINFLIGGVEQADIDTDGFQFKRDIDLNHTSITNADSPYTVVHGYTVILVDPTAGAVAVNLPTAASHSKRWLHIKDEANKAASNNITVTPNGADTIDLAAAAVLNIDGACLTLYSDGGTNWVIL